MDRIRSAVPVLALAALLAAGASAHAATAAAKAPAKAFAIPIPHPVVPFLEDEWPKALERARQEQLPVFVESWAPW
jgi:hypothetical protein